MRRIANILMPAFLLAGVVINIKESPDLPAGWNERIDKRSETGKVFENPTNENMAIISCSETHWDSDGNWANSVAVAADDTADGYDMAIRIKKHVYSIDTSDGRLHVLRKTGVNRDSLVFIPAFNTNDVGVVYDFSRSGLTFSCVLNHGNKIIWHYHSSGTVDTSKSDKPGGAKIKKVKADFGAWTATDSNGVSCPLSVTWGSDSLVVSIDTAGRTYPITVR